MAHKDEESITYAAKRYDQATAKRAADQLRAALRGAELVPTYDSAKGVLKALKGGRYFDLMAKVAEAYRGTDALAGQLTSFYVQALIENKDLDQAIEVAKAALVALHGRGLDPKETEYEESELIGLLGRAHKQRYVDRSEAGTAQKEDLLAAIEQYRKYDPETWWWHGVNAVACVARAQRDGIAVPGIDDSSAFVVETAGRIRGAIENHPIDKRGVWDLASATESSLAIYLETEDEEDLESARTWLNRYVDDKGGDAFEYSATLRQLMEVWQLRADRLPGSDIVPVLAGELMGHEGALLDARRCDVASRREALRAAHMVNPDTLQARLGRIGAIRYQAWKRAESRASWVCKIHEFDARTAHGTGLLVRGTLLDERLGAKFYVLTNDHVVSTDPTPYIDPPAGQEAVQPLSPDQAFVTSELGGGEKLAVKRIVAGSAELDYALLELTEDFTPSCSQVEELSLSQILPPVSDTYEHNQRFYVIGYPGGDDLSFSMTDNRLIDHEGPPTGTPNPGHVVRIHYRSPTAKGSSGSPVFDQTWSLVALHHAGGLLKMLNQKAGENFANEGIWIHSIREDLGGKDL